MISRGVDSRPMKISSPVYGFCLLPLFSFKSHKNSNYDKAPYIVSFPSPQANLFARLFTCPQGETKLPRLHRHTNKRYLNCTFSKSLINKQTNLTDPQNQGIKMQVEIKKEDRLCMKYLLPSTQCKGCFTNSTCCFWY